MVNGNKPGELKYTFSGTRNAPQGYHSKVRKDAALLLSVVHLQTDLHVRLPGLPQHKFLRKNNYYNFINHSKFIVSSSSLDSDLYDSYDLEDFFAASLNY